MTGEFMREERYIVFKMSDLGNSLKGDEIRRLAREYAEQRRLKGKKPLECVVVEKDWPEYEPTWKAIEARVTGAQPAPSVPDLNLSDPAVQKRLAAQWGYVPAGAQPSYLPSDLAEAIIADMQAQYDSEMITENASGEALIRLDGAIAAVEDNFAAATEAKK